MAHGVLRFTTHSRSSLRSSSMLEPRGSPSSAFEAAGGLLSQPGNTTQANSAACSLHWQLREVCIAPFPASCGTLYRRLMDDSRLLGITHEHNCLGVGTASAFTRCGVNPTLQLPTSLGLPQTGVTGGRYSSQTERDKQRNQYEVLAFSNDPAAGSPTATLLRLLLPLVVKYRWSSAVPKDSLPTPLFDNHR